MNPWKKYKNNDVEISGKYIKKSQSNYDNQKINDPHFLHNLISNKYIKYKKRDKIEPKDIYHKSHIPRNKLDCDNIASINDVSRDIDRKVNISDIKDKYVIKDNKLSFKSYIFDYIIRRGSKKQDLDDIKLSKKFSVLDSSNYQFMNSKNENKMSYIDNKNYSKHHLPNRQDNTNIKSFLNNDIDQLQHDKVLPIVPANPFLNAKIPDWLLIYSVAPYELDNNLKWDIFSLQQLESFEAILKRLYMQELEKIVMKYESYRTSLSKQTEQCLYDNIRRQSKYFDDKLIYPEYKQHYYENETSKVYYNYSLDNNYAMQPNKTFYNPQNMIIKNFYETNI